MFSSICLTKTSYKGMKLLHSLPSTVTGHMKNSSMSSYYFIDTNGQFSSPQKTYANTSFFPKKRLMKRSFQSQYLPKNLSLVSTEEKKEVKTSPKLINMSASTLLPFRKKAREKVDLINFLTEARKKKYVREKEVDQLKLQRKMHEASLKVNKMRTMCDFIYPYLLKIKEDRILNQIYSIKSKVKTRREKSVPQQGCIPVKLLYTQKVFHDRLYYFSDKEHRSNKPPHLNSNCL